MPFVKYHGNGNDFIVVDDRELRFGLTTEQIVKSCHRHFGIGSDGIIFIRPHATSDFDMVFHNPDGSQSLCGNGSRCAVDFANRLGIIGEACTFNAIDGVHEGKLTGEMRCVKLHDIKKVEKHPDGLFIHNGSPHFVRFVEDVDTVEVVPEGRSIRNSERFKPGGTNVNFVQALEGGIRSRVYERGVEDETFSSGTGTAAQAVCSYVNYDLSETTVRVSTRGGELEVSFKPLSDGSFSEVWLKGPVVRVYQGEVSI